MNCNDPDYIWTIWKHANGTLLGPSVDFGVPVKAVYALLTDLGEWVECDALGSPGMVVHDR